MVQYRRYGKNGPDVSCLGFGAMRLPVRHGDYDTVNYTRSLELMRAAMDAGVNLFDSHHTMYHGGHSEVAIGKALKGWKGHHIHVQTKTPWYQEKPTTYFETLLREALEKLGVPCIDYYLHHSLRMDAWKKRGKKFIKFTDRAMQRGLIRRRGFSSHDTPENIRSFIDTGEFSAMLVSYNWMNPAMRDTIAYAADRGMGVSVMNPVGGGTLAVRTPPVMRLLAGAGSAAEIAFRYVLATPGITCALSGMNTMEQLRENLVVAGRKAFMTPRQQECMQEGLRRIEGASRKFCTACGYCMPCPHGVDIPGNFALLSRARLFGHVQWARAQYTRLKKRPDGDGSAEACRQCEACEPKCPNGIPITRQLQDVAAILG